MAGFIVTQRVEHRVPHAVSCRALGVSPAWFYKWRHGDVSLRRARRAALAAVIGCLFARRHGSYGSPRITVDLRALGWRVSVNTVAEVMAERRLVARPKRTRRGTTRPDRLARKAPDAVGRDFRPPDRPDVRWCGDLTEIPNDEGRFYLAGVLDLHSRRCVGFAMDAHHDTALATAALRMGIAVRGGSVAGVVFHSDQGGEYTGEAFAAACGRAGITQSMGRTGSALDNAVAESFNSTLEFELLRHQRFTTREQARRAVADWIDEYNTVRRHSTNHMLSPVDYELAHAGVTTRNTTAGKTTEAAAPPRPHPRRAGYGAAPPASTVATRSLRDGLRPPLTPEPLRPLPASGVGRPGPAPTGARRHTTTITTTARPG